MFLYKIQLFFYKMPLTPPSFLSRLSILILMILFVPFFCGLMKKRKTLWKKRKKKPPAPCKLNSKQHFVLQIITSKAEQEIRKRIGKGKTSGSVKKSLSCLVGKPKGAIKELKWNIEGNGFKQVNTEQLQGELKIALTAKDDLEKDATAKSKQKQVKVKKLKLLSISESLKS